MPPPRPAAVALFGDPQSLAPPQVRRIDQNDGSFVLRHPTPMGTPTRCVGEWLEHWSRITPDALFLAERDGGHDGEGGWRRLSYGDVRARVGRIAQGLIDLDLPAGKPVVVLSDNSIDHALLALATMFIGRAVCTVSSAYSRVAKDPTKIRTILTALDPALVYAAQPSGYAGAIAAWGGDAPVFFSHDAPARQDFAALSHSGETSAVKRAFDAVRPEDDAKYLLTSGSTGMPKVVINSHRMLCANQQQIAQVWPFLTRHKLALLDWLPWSHTFGANHNFNMVLAHGGSLHIDEGRPAPGLIEHTVRNLREVQPNFYFNVPRGFDMLLPFLEADEALARDAFARLEGVFYAGAALPQAAWARLEALAVRIRERPLWFTSSWGATETAPANTSTHWRIDRAGCIGLPLPGVELKFVPNGDKLEMRVRGPNVFAGYRNAAELSAAAFDEQGFYKIGDAGRLVEDADATQGVAFDGRVAEDFKLGSGTWVSVGTLRLRALSALAPHIADAVVTGHDREQVGLLLFPTAAAAALPAATLAAHVREALRAMAAEALGSAMTPMCALVLHEPASVDAGEITDKGYLNQRAILERRADAVRSLYAPHDNTEVIQP
jgi:feruloyl-CoA synthase